MENWRNEVKLLFRNRNVSFFIVNDPDYLLNDENVLKDFVEDGYIITHYDDSISFRYLYETQYRSSLGKNEIKVLLYSNEEDSNIYPYDFYCKGYSVYLSINNIFPKFSPTIVRQLDKEDLDILFQVQTQYNGSNSDKETLEFILKYVFKIVHELIDSKVEFYKVLFTMHYGKKEIPVVIREHLINQLSSIPMLKDLPVSDLILSSQYFFKYIDKEWSQFIKELLKSKPNTIIKESEVYQTHPFTHADIRRLMDNLFIEGYLHKVRIGKIIQMPEWMRFGIEQDNEQAENESISLLYNKVKERLQNTSRYKDWLSIGNLLGDYNVAVLKSKRNSYDTETKNLLQSINKKFEEWMLLHYHSLTSLPPYPKPKMVHHIAQNLAASKDIGKNPKTALIVLDGMSVTQWKIIKQYLYRKGLNFEENGVFAWVPTLTSISRQSIFSGQMPVMFSNHLKTTSKEENHWKMFWEDHGILKQYVQFQKGLGKEAYNKSQITAFKRPNIKVYGAVIDVIDGFVHGATQGDKSIIAELDIWLQTNYLYNLLSDLNKANYAVYLTSDHGNTESIGIGRISEGVLVDQKGERVRVYTDKVIYKNSAEQIESIQWNKVGLPEDYHVLIAKYGQAFVNKDERIVSHGGISIEEVIVSFIKVIPTSEED